MPGIPEGTRDLPQDFQDDAALKDFVFTDRPHGRWRKRWQRALELHSRAATSLAPSPFKHALVAGQKFGDASSRPIASRT